MHLSNDPSQRFVSASYLWQTPQSAVGQMPPPPANIQAQQGTKPVWQLHLSANRTVWIPPSNLNQPLQQLERTIPNLAHVVPPSPRRLIPLPTIISIFMLMVVLMIGTTVYVIGTTIYVPYLIDTDNKSHNTAAIIITLGQEQLTDTFNLTATLSQKDVDVDAGIIPVHTLNSKMSDSQSGDTTGQQCIHFIIDWSCQNAVSQDDINNLDEQIRPVVKLQIEQDLHSQEQAQEITLIGNVSYTDNPPTANPSVGTTSKTVTVTVSLQGTQEYIKTTDASTIAIQKLQKQLMPNHDFATRIEVSKPVVQSVDEWGTAQIKIVAGGFIRYTIPQSDIFDIKKHIAGMSQDDARTFIAQYLKLNPNDIHIKVHYKSVLPENVENITVDPQYPSTIPSVELPVIPTPTTGNTP